MEKYLINFKNISWEIPIEGIRQKSYVYNNQRIRLVEFSDTFIEEDWCVLGHVGYVLKGEISVYFGEKKVIFKQGDGIFIPNGESHKHKAKVSSGGKALCILFEEIKNDI